MKENLWYQSFLVVVLFAYAGMARTDTAIYDKNYSVQGCKKKSHGTARLYPHYTEKFPESMGVRVPGQ